MLLDLTGSALLSNDLDLFCKCHHVPHVIETADEKLVLENLPEMQHLFRCVVSDYQRLRVSSLMRFCEIAEFNSETNVESTHTTHIMSGDQRVMDPYPAFLVIKFIDDRWQIASSQYAVDQSTVVGRALNKYATDK